MNSICMDFFFICGQWNQIQQRWCSLKTSVTCPLAEKCRCYFWVKSKSSASGTRSNFVLFLPHDPQAHSDGQRLMKKDGTEAFKFLFKFNKFLLFLCFIIPLVIVLCIHCSNTTLTSRVSSPLSQCVLHPTPSLFLSTALVWGESCKMMKSGPLVCSVCTPALELSCIWIFAYNSGRWWIHRIIFCPRLLVYHTDLQCTGHWRQAYWFGPFPLHTSGSTITWSQHTKLRGKNPGCDTALEPFEFNIYAIP